MVTNPELIIICTHGASRSGKDEALKMISRGLVSCGIHSQKLDFADPLRNATVELLGTTPSILADSVYRKKPQELLGGKTPVDFMRLLGTEFIRNNINQTFWCDIWKERVGRWTVTNAGANHLPIVVLTSDARFVDELDTVYSLHKDFQVEIHHLLIYNSNTIFSTHLSDKMNGWWLADRVAPTGAVAINYRNIHRLSNNTSLEDYHQVISEWFDKFILTVSEE